MSACFGNIGVCNHLGRVHQGRKMALSKLPVSSVSPCVENPTLGDAC